MPTSLVYILGFSFGCIVTVWAADSDLQHGVVNAPSGVYECQEIK